MNRVTNEIPKLLYGSSRRGAQMGRHLVGQPHGKVSLEPITDECPTACGAYDYQGAYWGCGKTVWRGCGFDEDGDPFQFTFRSESADDPDQVIADAKEATDEITGMVETLSLIHISEPTRPY